MILKKENYYYYCSTEAEKKIEMGHDMKQIRVAM